MKKTYNFPSGLACIELNKDEVKAIEKVIEICDVGNKLSLSSEWLWHVDYEDELKDVYEQGRNFSRVKMYLQFILNTGNLYYYKEKIRYMENWSKYMRSVHQCWERDRKLKKEIDK